MSNHPGETPIRPEDFLPESRNISNSEVTTFLSCKRQYDFSFLERGGLEPIERSRHLDRGTVGHYMFEKYIQSRLEGNQHNAAMAYSNDQVKYLMQTGQVEVDVVLEAQHLVTRYHGYHQGWPDWELLGTEERQDLKLTDTLNIAIRYDLMYRDKKTGKVFIGDWKFTYEFWTPNDHAVNGQMPKYVAVMRANGFEIDGGMLFEIRTRPLGKEKAADPKNLWKATPYYPSSPEMYQVMQQHVLASKQIEEHRALDDTYRREYVSLPVLNKYGPCKYCAFVDPCSALKSGAKDIEVMLDTQFQANTYGYNQKEESVGF